MGPFFASPQKRFLRSGTRSISTYSDCFGAGDAGTLEAQSVEIYLFPSARTFCSETPLGIVEFRSGWAAFFVSFFVANRASVSHRFPEYKPPRRLDTPRLQVKQA